jgi:hypothetical protein
MGTGRTAEVQASCPRPDAGPMLVPIGRVYFIAFFRQTHKRLPSPTPPVDFILLGFGCKRPTAVRIIAATNTASIAFVVKKA